MTNLTLTSNTETITSMEVAEMITKEHSKLLRDIHRYINQIEKINESKIGEAKIGFTDFFIESTYTTSQNKTQPCYNITHKGCEFIANKLTGIKGTEFTARYVNRFHELEENNTINVITTTMNTMSEAITTLTQSMTQMQQDINNLKSQTTQTPKPLPIKTYSPYSRWKANTFNKLKILTEYANEHSDQELKLSDTLHITINELQDTYDIDLSDYTNDYMLIHSSENKPYDLDVIDYYKDIKTLYNQVLNSIMESLNLATEPLKQNIFHVLVQNMA